MKKCVGENNSPPDHQCNEPHQAAKPRKCITSWSYSFDGAKPPMIRSNGPGSEQSSKASIRRSRALSNLERWASGKSPRMRSLFCVPQCQHRLRSCREASGEDEGSCAPENAGDVRARRCGLRDGGRGRDHEGPNTIARVANDATKMRTIMMYTAPEILIVFGP